MRDVYPTTSNNHNSGHHMMYIYIYTYIYIYICILYVNIYIYICILYVYIYIHIIHSLYISHSYIHIIHRLCPVATFEYRRVGISHWFSPIPLASWAVTQAPMALLRMMGFRQPRAAMWLIYPPGTPWIEHGNGRYTIRLKQLMI